MAQARDFFHALWGDSEGYAELRPCRTGSAKPQFYRYPDQIDSFLKAAETASDGYTDVYYGVNLRKAPAPPGKGGTLKDVSLVTAIWADIDFRKFPSESEATKALREFPLVPSAEILSGGGIHVYWFLREPSDDFDRITRILRALHKAIRSDPKVGHLAALLRVPGTINPRYTPKRTCTIRKLDTESPGFNLSDFEDVLPIPEETPKKPPLETPAPKTSGKSLPMPKRSEIIREAAKFWREGHRHEAALYLSAILADAGCTIEDAEHIIRTICEIAGDEEVEDRLRAARDTYERYRAGEPVAGYGQLSELVEEMPERAQRAARKVSRQLRGKKPRRKDPGFKIIKLVRWASALKEYTVTIEIEGRQYTVQADQRTFWHFRLFDCHFWAETAEILPTLTQDEWKEMLRGVHIETIEAPPEMSAKGEVESVLEEFLDDRVSNPDPRVLRYKAGVDERGVFFRTNALMAELKKAGTKARKSQVGNFLREMGWVYKPIRIGGKLIRVWIRQHESNGQASPKSMWEDPR